MHLTQFTDYSLRVLIYLGVKGEQASVAEVAKAYGVSRNHLVKVVHHLSTLGVIQSTKGKLGGIRLAVPPERINIGDIVVKSEPLEILECFNAERNTCPLMGCCDLQELLEQARAAFLDRLRAKTLADLMSTRHRAMKRSSLGLG